jgi:hypothetical protein
MLSSSGCAKGWLGSGSSPCPIAGEEAIEEYESMVEAYGEERVPHWMAYYGDVIRYCDAQDVR